MGPKNGWRVYWTMVRALRAYFRHAEYPMGPVESCWQAVTFAWRWP